MNAINRATRRRLQQLPQTSVWEGDRCAMAPDIRVMADSEAPISPECILWVDGVDAIVRSIDVVTPEAGPEAVVRSLIRAMETPQNPGRPARPQKVVVRNRELQFYLRGVLQDLDITVEYAPTLPLIDEILRGVQEFASSRPPQLPLDYVEPLLTAARDLWLDAPWEILNEEQILAIELNYAGIETLYVSILGLLGVEYGVLMYRSLDSLKAFRSQILAPHRTQQQMEEAFLRQDCLFLTYDQLESEEDFPELDEDEAIASLQQAFQAFGVYPDFGNLHPLEGMRPVLYEEEAAAALVAISAMHRFFQQHLAALDVDEDAPFPQKTGRYRMPDPQNPEKKLSIKVSTLPMVTQELSELAIDVSGVEIPELASENLLPFPLQPALLDDLVPDDSYLRIDSYEWQRIEMLRSSAQHYQAAESKVAQKGDRFSVILIQTSRPKAIAMMEGIEAAGGLQGLGFIPGEDPFMGENYAVGVLKTQNGLMHLFGDFDADDPGFIDVRKRWEQQVKKNKGFCGLVIARGLKGSSSKKPTLQDMMAFYEVPLLTPKELGLSSLKLMPQL
jgi:hypothetical protein